MFVRLTLTAIVLMSFVKEQYTHTHISMAIDDNESPFDLRHYGMSTYGLYEEFMVGRHYNYNYMCSFQVLKWITHADIAIQSTSTLLNSSHVFHVTRAAPVIFLRALPCVPLLYFWFISYKSLFFRSHCIQTLQFHLNKTNTDTYIFFSLLFVMSI